MAFGTGGPAEVRRRRGRRARRRAHRPAPRRQGRAAHLRRPGADAARAARRPPRDGRRCAARSRPASRPTARSDPEALARALRRLTRLARKPGLVVVVSDFREPDGWQRPLRGARRAPRGRLRRGHRPARGRAARRRHRRDGRPGDRPPPRGRPVLAQAARGVRDRRARPRAASVAADIRRAGARHVALWSAGDWLRGLGAGLARAAGTGVSLQRPARSCSLPAADPARASSLHRLAAARRRRYAIRFPAVGDARRACMRAPAGLAPAPARRAARARRRRARRRARAAAARRSTSPSSRRR